MAGRDSNTNCFFTPGFRFGLSGLDSRLESLMAGDDEIGDITTNAKIKSDRPSGRPSK